MKPTTQLEMFIPKYLAARFLYDYLDDQSLLNRLNGIMRRVNLTPLPDSMCSVIHAARPLVRERLQELLYRTVEPG